MLITDFTVDLTFPYDYTMQINKHNKMGFTLHIKLMDYGLLNMTLIQENTHERVQNSLARI